MGADTMKEKKEKNLENDDASVNIDVIFAITIVIGVVIIAIQTMPTMSHEDRDWRIKQYMAVTRATDSLVQDGGESGNYSNITKIGLVYIKDDMPIKKVLDIEKVRALMGGGYKNNSDNVTWWEFPLPDTAIQDRDNFTRMLGLSGYNFYIQLHPVGLKSFDSIPLQTNLSSKNINFDMVSIVDRYVYIIDPSIGDKIKYLKYDNEAIHYRMNIWVW
jgi:hypothetical protein